MADFNDPIKVVPFSFADLPEDVQLCILSFLSPSDISIFACTSKRFVHLCRNDNNKLWFSICDRKWGSKTQISKWVNPKITYKQLYKILTQYENLIGFWRRTGQASDSPPLIFFEWGPSFVSGSRVSPSKTGTYRVTKAPFLWMSVTPKGEPLNFLYPDCELELSDDSENELIPVNVSFVGNNHVVVEESLMQRKREKETLPEKFVKVVDCSPTPSRPLQGLWKGMSNDMNLDFYVVEYDDIGGIECRRVWDSSKPFSCYFPVFWTADTEFVEFPASPGDEYLYCNRVHLQPLASANGVQRQSWTENETVSGILCINSCFDMVIRDMVGTSGNTRLVEGMIWLYKDGTFGYGFLRDNYIIDLKHVARNGCLLDAVELDSD